MGTALSNTSDGEMTWRSVLWSYGGKEVEADGKTMALDSKRRARRSITPSSCTKRQ